MDAKLKADWIAALRSGEFKQCRRALRHTSGGYCCLGVATIISGYAIGPHDTVLRQDGRVGDSAYAALADFGLEPEIRSSLIKMNDSGAPFSQIADYIEANIPADDHSVTE